MQDFFFDPNNFKMSSRYLKNIFNVEKNFHQFFYSVFNSFKNLQEFLNLTAS